MRFVSLKRRCKKEYVEPLRPSVKARVNCEIGSDLIVS
jgi:hypothetical protein